MPVPQRTKWNGACMHMPVPCQPLTKRNNITWNVTVNARNKPQDAKHNETTEIKCDSKNHETSTPVRKETLKTQNAMRLWRSNSARLLQKLTAPDLTDSAATLLSATVLIHHDSSWPSVKNSLYSLVPYWNGKFQQSLFDNHSKY